MKPSKRVKKAINDLHNIKEVILYSCAGNLDHYNENFQKKFTNIEETLLSLAQDKKLFGIQLKKTWEEQNG